MTDHGRAIAGSCFWARGSEVLHGGPSGTRAETRSTGIKAVTSSSGRLHIRICRSYTCTCRHCKVLYALNDINVLSDGLYSDVFVSMEDDFRERHPRGKVNLREALPRR